ncbi:Rieske 2Fe-2S domain-containing protein [Candidatus Poriferisocius sp.]|uniref:Rieske 2Fe-2S domain-containing protein n=1 Tax=Candidatus Poriferisocius sp. TaxID=3101276 RepID=UPI003B01481A
MTLAPESSQAKRAPTVPPVGLRRRVADVTRWQTRELLLGVLRRFGPWGAKYDQPRREPLHSGSIKLYRWHKKAYGSEDKPISLLEIPWDYVEENQHQTPFLGLREYWYPALISKELRNNQPKAITLLGDNLVFFRDGSGQARALDNRCPHRGAFLSLGQVGVYEAGTITCRYHGMTFDGNGECVAYLTDGPNSSIPGRIRARSYPVEEHNGVIFIYMGEREPEPVIDSVPHADTVLKGEGEFFLDRVQLPYSYLNLLDNTVDLTHPGILHRNCLQFIGQATEVGSVSTKRLPDGGLYAYFTDTPDHPGRMNLVDQTWYLPNMIYAPIGRSPVLAGGGWGWFVPVDIGNHHFWFIARLTNPERAERKLLTKAKKGMASFAMGRIAGRDFFWPGSAKSCLDGGDAPIQASQGRIVRWDMEKLTSADRATVQVRRIMQEAHQAEIAERAANGIPERRIHRPLAPMEREAPVHVR